MEAEELIPLYMRQAIAIRMQVDLETQTSISVAKYANPLWKQREVFQVVPGPATMEGGGDGAQVGGDLMRQQTYSVFYFVRNNMDSYGESTQALTNASIGTLKRFAQLRDIFSETMLQNRAGTIVTLNRHMEWQREGQTVWEDKKAGLCSREFVWSTFYGVTLPTETTLYIDELANALP